jgi:hypothetical protein
MKTNQPITSASKHRGNQSFHFWPGKLAVLAALVLPIVSANAVTYQWGRTNVNSIGNWSDSTKWTNNNATTPGSADSVVIDHQSPGPWTNVMDLSATTPIQDLTYQGIGDEGGTSASGVNTTIANGMALSVLGGNGFSVSTPVALNFRPVYNFFGDTLIVSNPAANFIVNGTMSTANNTKYVSVDMSGLTNLAVTVNRVGVADFMLLGSSVPTIGGSQAKFFLARNTVIKAGYSSDYSQLDFTNSIEFNRQSTNTTIANNLGANMSFNLGLTNYIYADSIGIARGGANATGTAGAGSGCGYVMQFKPAFTNPVVASTALAYFRSTTASRMSLLAIAVDSGTNGIGSSSAGKNRGMLDLRGGKVDMLVDKIWLGRNRTNSPSTADDIGEFLFENGTVDANTVQVGYMQYTNAVVACGGWLVVGTNGTLVVNNNLKLGHTPLNAGLESTNVAATYGQLIINNNGKVLANQINVGLASVTNQIIVSGLLTVSNTIAQSPANALTTLNLTGGSMTLFPVSGATNAFVTNLLTSGTVTINIGSYSGPVPATNVLINYQTAGHHNVTTGTYPVAFNNMQVSDDDAGNIVVKVLANSPRNLVWRGGQSALWNHADLNWQDTNTLSIVPFNDNDRVVFDDTAAVPTNILVAESVSPGSFRVTNSVNQFVFSPSGGTIAGTLVKTGTQSVQVACPSTLAVNVNQGSLTGNGSVANITIASGASMNFAGTVSSALTVAGNATLAVGGVVNGAASVQSGATLSNAGTLSGPLSMSSGSTVSNTGLMNSIGSATITTNSVLSNAGTIFGGDVVVAPGGTLVDTVAGSAAASSGSINVVSLTVNGTFKPGNGSISITKVTDYNNANSPQGGITGRVALNQGSTTLLVVNMDNPLVPTNSLVLSHNQTFGGSLNSKSFTGGTLLITNTGATAYAPGQSFKFFGYYADGTDFLDAGFNTTNTYPVVQPATPGAGLRWELDQLYKQGIVRVVSASDPLFKFAFTNSPTTFSDNGTNKIITDLTWPSDKAGGWVQTLNTTLATGLSATNWVNLNQNALTNMPPNEFIITNTITGEGAVFYRFVYP